MKKRILVIVDMQKDFMHKDGSMYIEGADTLVSKTNKFLKNLSPDAFDMIVIVQDTHTLKQDLKTLHCLMGTPGWELAIDPTQAQGIDMHFILKKGNDMWQENEKMAQILDVGNGTEVAVIGVATNYCVHDAMLGFLEHGCKVVALQDLMRGIKTDSKNPNRAASGDIRDVIQLEAFKPYTDGAMLTVCNSSVYTAPAPQSGVKAIAPKAGGM